MAREKKQKRTGRIINEAEEEAREQEDYRKSPQGIRESNNKKLLRESLEKVKDLEELAKRLEKQREKTLLRIAADATAGVNASSRRRYEDIEALIGSINDSCGKARKLMAEYRRKVGDEKTQTSIHTLNDHLGNLESNLTKVIQPNFLANLSYWLKSDKEPSPEAKFGVVALDALLIAGMVLLIILGGIFLPPLIIPGIIGLVGGVLVLGAIVFDELGGRPYFGELALNYAKGNPDYQVLLGAIEGISATYEATFHPKNLEGSEFPKVEKPLVDPHEQSHKDSLLKGIKPPPGPVQTPAISPDPTKR